MTKTLLTVLLSISILPAFSQQDSLLKNFKYRIDYFRAINFNLGTARQLNKDGVSSSTVTNSSTTVGFGASYFAVNSTDKILFITTAYLNGGFSSSRYNYLNSVTKSNNLAILPQINLLNKWFFKNKFIELGADLFTNTYTNKSTVDNPKDLIKSTQLQYGITFNTGIGKGRLENITDMQNALWLSKALQAANSLSQPLSASELNELGRTITTANNTRILDTRKRIQFILETVDNHLQKKGLVNKTDIKYFSNLNDILFFAFNTPRLSGTEKYIRFTPGITGYGNNQKQNSNLSKYERRFNTKSLILSTGINKYTPQNLVHQNNYGASFKVSYNSLDFIDKNFTADTITRDTKTNTNLKQAAINLFYEHSIYPNTRTSINFNLDTQGGYQDIEKKTNFFGSVNLAGTVNYFISYRTRLTASLGAIYQKNVYNIQQSLNLLPDNFRTYVNAGVNISL